MKHSFIAKNSFLCKRDWLCAVHEEVCTMSCSRVHAFGDAYSDGFPYNITHLFCSASVFGHLKLCSRFCSCKM